MYNEKKIKMWNMISNRGQKECACVFDLFAFLRRPPPSHSFQTTRQIENSKKYLKMDTSRELISFQVSNYNGEQKSGFGHHKKNK